jgi:hypothetical protein
VTEGSSAAVPTRGLANAPLNAESARELVQQRIALLARVCLIFGLLIQATVRWVAFSARETSYGAATDWTPNAHLVVLAMSAAVWLRARSSRRSPRELALLDFFCVMPPVAFSLIALWQAPPDLKPDLLNTIGAGDLLILRAVLVPSTGRRTAVLGAGIASAIVVWTYAYYSLHPDPSGGTPLLHVVTMTTWCSTAVIVSTLASHTIFGLRQRSARPPSSASTRCSRSSAKAEWGSLRGAPRALAPAHRGQALAPAQGWRARHRALRARGAAHRRDLAERLASTAARRDFTRDDARAAWQRVRRRVPTEAPTRTAVASTHLLTVELKRRAASGR